MSKESSIPVHGSYPESDGTFRLLPLRWRRYPVSRDIADLIGADKESGHNVPPPSARRRR